MVRVMIPSLATLVKSADASDALAGRHCRGTPASTAAKLKIAR